jgi:predicted dinucleotide-utilizing enzyme
MSNLGTGRAPVRVALIGCGAIGELVAQRVYAGADR